MDDFYLDIHLPEKGKVERWHCDPGEQLFIRWAPGNGLNYIVMVNVVSDEAQGEIGGYLLTTIRVGSSEWISYPLSPTGLLTKDYLSECFKDKLTEEQLLYYTALINWVLFNNDTAVQYGNELFDEAKNKWV